MKVFKYICILTIYLFLHSATRAQQKTLLLFYPTEGSKNGKDISQLLKDKSVFVVFYKMEDDERLIMSIVFDSDSTQTKGWVYPHEVVTVDEGYQGYRAEKAYYKWEYYLPGSEDPSIATVELTKAAKPEGMFYMLKLFYDPFEILILKGYYSESDPLVNTK